MKPLCKDVGSYSTCSLYDVLYALWYGKCPTSFDNERGLWWSHNWLLSVSYLKGNKGNKGNKAKQVFSLKQNTMYLFTIIYPIYYLYKSCFIFTC